VGGASQKLHRPANELKSTVTEWPRPPAYPATLKGIPLT